ncbi:MAG: hypothetical protein ACO28P_01370 [Ilumatobacteraceae bacterium]
MATKFSVTYADSDEPVIVSVKPRDILRIERESGSIEATVEASFKLAYYASGSKASFDEWLEGVDDIEPVEQPGAESANPT